VSVRLCSFCARPALSISNACIVCLRALDRETATLTAPAFLEDAKARASRPSEWLGKVAECDGFRADLQARPIVSGSLDSLAGLEPGRAILLELTGKTLVGRELFDVPPAPAVVAGRPGSLYVDASDKSRWTPAQCEAYRKLDELVEQLDHAADAAPRPLGDVIQDEKRREDGPPARHARQVAADKARKAEADKAEKKASKAARKAAKKERTLQRAKAGKAEFPAWIQRRKGGGL